MAAGRAAARLNTYLINDYFDDFASAIHLWVGKAMLLESPSHEHAQARPQQQARMSLRRPSGAPGLEWPQLHRLYGKKVGADELLSLAAAAPGAEEEDAARLATHAAAASSSDHRPSGP